MAIIRRDYPDIAPQGPTFSRSVRSRNWLFVAGCTARGTDARKTIQQRWRKARHEIQDIRGYDYFIVNRDLDDAVNRLAAIIAAEQ